MRRAVVLCIALAAVLVSVAAALATPTAPVMVAKCDVSIGVLAPITGQVAAIGQQMVRWSQTALTLYNKQKKTSYTMVQGDTQLTPAQATTITQRFVSNPKIVVLVGPPSSTEVEAIGRMVTRVSLAMVSASATKASLTGGKYPTFFRVVPNDAVQGPTNANFMVDKLHAKKVFVLDNQAAASVGLADSVQQTLEKRGVKVQRESTPNTTTDFSSIVSGIADDTDVAFIPFIAAANAQLFADQMQEQGKKAIPFGSDAEDSPSEFHPEGGYVASAAPDVTQVKGDASIVKAYRARYGEFTSTIGPPMYAATWVVLDAVNRVCASGKPVTRAAVLRAVRTTKLATSILGGPISFTRRGDVQGAHFYVFKTHANQKYELVQG
jgi:branched-chain amino acid transport system substrate-binding protein